MHEGNVRRLRCAAGPPWHEDGSSRRDVLWPSTAPPLPPAHVSTLARAHPARGQDARHRRARRGDAAPPAAHDASVIGYDTACKVNPPLREPRKSTPAPRPADGTIDAIATDHAPHSRSRKTVSVAERRRGMIGLELCFGCCGLVGESDHPHASGPLSSRSPRASAHRAGLL